MIFIQDWIDFNISTAFISGDSTVGKSALSQVFHSDGAQFPKSYMMVRSITFFSKVYALVNYFKGV